jgi:hypothetical protein
MMALSAPASQRLEQRLSVFGRLALRPSDEPVAKRMAAYVQFMILEKRPGGKLKLMSDLVEARGAIIRRLFAKQGVDVGSTSHGRPRASADVVCHLPSRISSPLSRPRQFIVGNSIGRNTE